MTTMKRGQCPRCSTIGMRPDEDGDPHCSFCGYTMVDVPKHLRDEVERDGSQSARKPTHAGVRI